MDFNKELIVKKEFFDTIINNYTPCNKVMYDKIIYEAMNYSLKAGGKRIRPILMQQSYELFGGSEETIEAFMVAIEMIHTYSLIHDDLPAMDDDDYRRGLPTCHKKYGEDMAILTGDALLNYAYELMTNQCLQVDKTPIKNKVKAMQEISRASGVHGMIAGQVVDILSEDKPITLDVLNYIHTNKTSAIIEASLAAGGYLAEAAEEEIELLRKIGRCIGIAFQIQDDILDVVSTTKELGKPVNSDIKNGKTTYVTLKGIDESNRIVSELLDEALSNLAFFEESKAEFLKQFILYIRDRKN